MPTLSSIYTSYQGITDAELLTVSHTTGSLADLASTTHDFTISKISDLRSITADRACKIRLYSSASGRSSDTRDYDVNTNPHNTLLFDGEFTSAGTLIATLTRLLNQESPINSTIYAKIWNLSGSTSTVSISIEVVTFSYNSLGGRETLGADRTYYVRTDGNDNNNGLSNTSGGAFLTIQKAVDTACGIDKGLYNITIQVGNGTYTTPVTLKRHYGNGSITIKGDSTTPSNVVLSTTSANCIYSDNTDNWILDGLKLQTSTSGICLFLTRISEIQIKNLDFGSSAGGYHIYLTGISSCVVLGNYTISGSPSTGSHILSENNSVFRSVAYTITVLNTPAFSASNGFAFAHWQGSIDYVNSTFSGSATGRYYNAMHGGHIRGTVNGNFPGNAAGTTSAGGYYST